MSNNYLPLLLGAIGLIVVLFLVLTIEVLIARRGESENFVNPSSTPIVMGDHKSTLRYAVLGDSTAAGQGAPYDQGIAMLSAAHLAKDYRVEMINLSSSGAVSADVVKDQLNAATKFNPDLVLISVGANDTTHLVRPSRVLDNLNKITSDLVKKNCNIKIVITGSPDMGTSPRFLRPLSDVLTSYTGLINNSVYKWTADNHFTLAPIARNTSKAFRQDPTLFAGDRYHPNTRGYQVWLQTIIPAIDDAMATQPSHC